MRATSSIGDILILSLLVARTTLGLLTIPFCRLVHIWSAPVEYLTRRYQLVRNRR